jgi:hypothetical protein
MSLCGIWGMDDQMGTLIGEAVKIITEYENVFLTGKRDDSLAKVPEGKVEVCSWKNGARQISFVFNDQASDAKCILEHKDGRSQKLTVPARDCKVIEWTK